MTDKVSLLFGVHAHQPVGNFPKVLDEAHARCYGPFLRTLAEYPEFRFAVHFSGWLLDYLATRFPRDIALLKDMVARGQVEVFGGGDMEPVLAAIPHRDRLGQVQRLTERVKRTLGAEPAGAWLTERVWESSVVPALADAGIRYVTVDDYHFLCTGKAARELDGYFTTEEDGRALDLFPISEALRYRLPFSPAPDAVAYLESLATAGTPSAIYFDDIEKFGIWPETYQWVYEKKWLEQFIAGVLASPKIVTRSYRAYHADTRTRGIVYLPTASYIEMNEWTLPAKAGHVYADLVARARNEGSFETHKPFLRGGIWRNFLTRYPEANWMHKRMLGLSQRLQALPRSRRVPTLLNHLYTAQANDAYWHGLFGGLYLPHLRRAVYGGIVELEALLDSIAPRAALIVEDFDRDGAEEAMLRNSLLQAVVRLDADAAVIELDSYPLKHNFGDTLRRHAEHYYRKIERREQAQHDGGGIASAHDVVAYKHEITPQDLVPDAHPRACFLDRLLGADGAEARPAYALAETSADRGAIEFRARIGDASVEKRIELRGATLSVRYRFDGGAGATFATQLSFALPSCDGYSGRYVYRGEYPCGFGQPLALPAVDEITLDDLELRGRVKLGLSPPARLAAAPHFTVSQSEAGFEKIMQAATLDLEWPLAPGMREITVTLAIEADGEID